MDAAHLAIKMFPVESSYGQVAAEYVAVRTVHGHVMAYHSSRMTRDL